MGLSDSPAYPQFEFASRGEGNGARERATFPSMLLIAASLLAACAPPPYPSGDTSKTGGTDTGLSGELGIGFTWPPNETSVTGCITVVVNYAGITLTDPNANPEPAEGQGHYHVTYADTYALCMAPYCLIDFDKDDDTGTDGITGEVLLTAQIMDNAHQPILDDAGDAISDTLFVNVTAGECAEGSGSAY